MKNYYQTLNKFFDIITPKQRREYWMYFFLFIVAAILETLGISLIFILLKLIYYKSECPAADDRCPAGGSGTV